MSKGIIIFEWGIIVFLCIFVFLVGVGILWGLKGFFIEFSIVFGLLFYFDFYIVYVYLVIFYEYNLY